jgi:hypothetical protein
MFKSFFFLISFLIITLFGCKKFADPGVIDEKYTPGVASDTLKERKMLFISIDGLSSEALQAVNPVNIQELLKNSKYTWNVASAARATTNAASWASMMTGNDTTRHRTWDSTFYPTPIDTTNRIPVPVNLTALRYLHNKNQSLTITAIAPWFNLVNTFLVDANTKIVTTGDADTKNNAVNEIKTKDPALIITQFNSVQKAGIQYGFSASVNEFSNAIKTVDGYINEMVLALKSRPDYAKENWLVFITTTQGGSGLKNDVNIKPGFIIAYSPYFKPANIFTLTPSIATRKEDIAPQILYWFKTAVPNTIASGSVWIDRFEAEFYK